MEQKKITILIDGSQIEVEEGVTYEELAKKYQQDYTHQIAAVFENGKIRELIRKPVNGCEVKFITIGEDIGYKAYIRTATLLFMKAAQDVIGRENINQIKVEFAIGTGYFCSCSGDFTVDRSLADKIENRMKSLVGSRDSIHKYSYPVEKAIELFSKQGMKDKEKLCKFRRSSVINVYELDGYYDYYYGYMLPNTGCVSVFSVIPYHEGLILNLPSKERPEELQPFVPLDQLFATMMDATEWSTKLEIDSVGDLNDKICAGELNDIILVQEALQERRIGEIAQDIVSRGGVKFVMIAGPSSSGKTTFSHRLSIQLRTHGLKPHPIAVDDYFVNREDTPLDEKGDYNFECLEAIDVDQFNQDMEDLLAGKTVELPTFNFKTGHREYKGNYKVLGPDDILVIEGIHALNDKMSLTLPVESKYKIYISALTTLNVDEHNRIPTTDGRLLRRMVRDARTRGSSAKRTIQMWPSVRRGEEENIFPFQESADAMFNSALIYELAALKPFAEPLLYSITKEDPEYYEAKRLLKFLEYFLSIDTAILPLNSICREFVGGSYFNV